MHYSSYVLYDMKNETKKGKSNILHVISSKKDLAHSSLEPPFRNFILPKKHIYYYHIIYVVLFSSRLKDNETNYDETSVVKRASKIRNNTLLLMHGSGYVLLHLSKIVHLFSIKRHSRSDVRQSASEPTKAAFSLSFLVK